MSWTSITPEEKQTIFRSEATDYSQVAEDLKTVVARMIEEKGAEGASDAKALLFAVNATNGFVKIVWWDNDASKALGSWMYQIMLKKLWENNIDDAFAFDNEVHIGLCCFTEYNMITDEGDSIYDVYEETELTGIELLLV